MDNQEMKTESKVAKTVADTIWDNIKGMKLDIFGLPGQFVEKYCSQKKIEPSKLYLEITCQAVLPALEEALKDKYVVEQVERYISVSNIKASL